MESASDESKQCVFKLFLIISSRTSISNLFVLPPIFTRELFPSFFSLYSFNFVFLGYNFSFYRKKRISLLRQICLPPTNDFSHPSLHLFLLPFSFPVLQLLPISPEMSCAKRDKRSSKKGTFSGKLEQIERPFFDARSLQKIEILTDIEIAQI